MIGPATLAYVVAYGFAVLPLASLRKEPLGSLVPHGSRDASADQATVRRWWERCPDANVGIATGELSGLAVLDIDPRSEGDVSLAALEAKHGPLPDAPTVLTGGGGVHLYFRWDERLADRKAAPITPGLDVKLNGGYVVAPPSIHPNGREYVWEASLHLDDTPLPPLPSWVMSLLRPRVDSAVAPAGPVGACLLGLAFADAGWSLGEIDSGRLAVRCPWNRQHTTQGSRSSTVVFAACEGSRVGKFHCSHEHCRDRTLDDVLAVLPAGALEAASETLYSLGVERRLGLR